MGKKKKSNRVIRWTARIVLAVLVLCVAVLVFIRSPWGQEIIVSRVVSYISDRTNTKVVIDRLYLDFSGNLVVEGVFLEDKKGDTLLYSELLEANLAISPLVFNNELDLESLRWENVHANISRNPDSDLFNYEFLIEAFNKKKTPSQSTGAEPMKITLGSLDLSDFLIHYNDEYTGMESRIRLGQLELEAKTTDLEGMWFDIATITLSNSAVSLVQNHYARESDSVAATMPRIRIREVKMEHVALNFKSVPDSLNADFTIGESTLALPEANLASNEFRVDQLSLKNSGLRLNVPGQVGESRDTILVPIHQNSFLWPQFKLDANNITFQNTSLEYKAGNGGLKNEGFDPTDINISGLEMVVKNISYKPENFDLELSNMSFAERGGISLRHLSFNSKLDKAGASLSDLSLQTNGSLLEGGIHLQFTTVQELMDSPEKTMADIQMSRIRLAVEEAFLLDTGLRNNQYLQQLSKAPVTGSINASGNLTELSLQSARFAWGDSTSIEANGIIKDITRTDRTSFVFDSVNMASSRGDVLGFVPHENPGFSLPREIDVSGSIAGSADQMEADLKVVTSSGDINLKGRYQSNDEIRFVGNAEAENIHLDSLIINQQLGRLSFDVEFSGSGRDVQSLDTKFDIAFSRLDWGDYDFSNLELEGNLVDGRGRVQFRYKDDNLDLAGDSNLDLTGKSPEATLDLEVAGANLQALGLTREDIRTGFEIKAEYAGTGSDFNLNARILKGIAVYDDQQYQLGAFRVTSAIDSVNTAITIDGDILNGSLRSNTSVKGMELALRKQFKEYFEAVPDTLNSTDSVNVALRFKLTPNPVLDEVFFRDIERLDSIVIRADYQSSTKNVHAVLHMPSAVYKGSAVDSLHIVVEGNASDLNFSAGLGSVEAGPIKIKNTTLSGNLNNHKLMLDLNSTDGTEAIMHIASELDFLRDTVYLHIKPTGLVLNSGQWTIPENNRIIIAKQTLEFQNVELSRAGQNLVISNDFDGIEKEHIGIGFTNFRLQTFLSLLNPDKNLASGAVSGELVIENPFGATGMISNFRIADFQVMETGLGLLSFSGTSEGRSDYGFNMELEGAGADLELTGSYRAAATGAHLNLDLGLNRVDLRLIESFSNGALRETAGFVSGNIEVSGTTASPEYEGSLRFNEATFNIATLNSDLRISDELLKLDTKGIYFDQFNIADANGNDFSLDGSILTADLLNPEFDIAMDTENFRILNSTKEDNELFYGLASVDAELTLEGNLDLPRIAGRLRIRKVTEITYVIPETQLDIQERDGVVIFVNRENPDAILTRNEEETGPESFKGLDVSAVVEIDEDAELSIIIDERTGDNLKVSGEGDLNLNIEPNGRTNLSGRYELQSGHYETSLYNLVNRRFEISPGSSITWQGDPLDAKLDVTAVYSVETSAAPLMATVISGQGTSLAGQYRQVLPFLVYLNVEGDLLEPELSFDLDMPEDEQGIFGGAVYSRVQQLNQQEAELNKQVFSLLALNRFYPASGSDGTAGGTAAIARDNVNKVLSGELNAFSDRVFGDSGFEVDFDLDSFTDYQGETPQDRTQLNINASKKLFDDRFIVTAGSAVDVEGSAQPGQEETPIIGNLSLEYLLTENGRYRLRGFRKSEYENIIEGQLIITGLALIFNREFNEFSELFSPLGEPGEHTDKKE